MVCRFSISLSPSFIDSLMDSLLALQTYHLCDFTYHSEWLKKRYIPGLRLASVWVNHLDSLHIVLSNISFSRGELVHLISVFVSVYYVGKDDFLSARDFILSDILCLINDYFSIGGYHA
jgi:hypothetical protein